MIGQHEALIYAMVLTSAADSEMTDSEMQAMGLVVRTMPAFREFDQNTLPGIAAECAEKLSAEGGLDLVLDQMSGALSPNLCETAYALALEIAAADLHAAPEELRVLELLRHRLDIDRLAAAALERGARARHRLV